MYYHGPEKRPRAAFRGRLVAEEYVQKLEIEMTLADDEVDQIVGLVLKTARTNVEGDGYVSIRPLEHRYDIHSGRRETC